MSVDYPAGTDEEDFFEQQQQDMDEDAAYELWRENSYDNISEKLDELKEEFVNESRGCNGGYFHDNTEKFWKAVKSFADFKLIDAKKEDWIEKDVRIREEVEKKSVERDRNGKTDSR